MNLLSLLLRIMTSKAAISALSGKAGSSSKQTSLLISLAIPILLKYLTGNASSQSGASSLLGALMQHTSKKSMAAQLQDADEEDGSKIISHILGDDTSAVISQLSQQTGMSEDMVSILLDSMAPGLMSGLSAAASTASASESNTGADHVDFTDLFNTFEPEPQSQEQPSSDFGGLGLLGTLLGLGSSTGTSGGSAGTFGASGNQSGTFNPFGGSQSGAINPFGGSAGTSGVSGNQSGTINPFGSGQSGTINPFGGGQSGTTGSDPMIDLFSGSSQGDYNGSSLLDSLMAIMRK